MQHFISLLIVAATAVTIPTIGGSHQNFEVQHGVTTCHETPSQWMAGAIPAGECGRRRGGDCKDVQVPRLSMNSRFETRRVKLAIEVCRERGGPNFPEGDVDEAEHELRRRLRVNELDVDASLHLGDLLHLVRRDADSAAACFEKVLESEPRNIHAMRSYALVMLRERSDYARAELLLSRVLARQPHDIRALELKAWLELYVHRRARLARQTCERALQACVS